jgi:hypothetical protein
MQTQYQISAAKTYRLAKDGAFQIVPFGPLMTLAKAESYRDDLAICFPNILVVNTVTQ